MRLRVPRGEASRPGGPLCNVAGPLRWLLLAVFACRLLHRAQRPRYLPAHSQGPPDRAALKRLPPPQLAASGNTFNINKGRTGAADASALSVLIEEKGTVTLTSSGFSGNGAASSTANPAVCVHQTSSGAVKVTAVKSTGLVLPPAKGSFPSTGPCSIAAIAQSP